MTDVFEYVSTLMCATNACILISSDIDVFLFSMFIVCYYGNNLLRQLRTYFN